MTTFHCHQCLVAALAILVGLGAVAEVFAEDTLAFVLNAHSAARDGIRTLHCKTVFKGKLKASEHGAARDEFCNGEFWWTPEAVRGSIRENDTETEYHWREMVKNGITTRRTGTIPEAGASRSRQPNRAAARCDPFARALLALNVPGTIEYVPFDALVKRASRVIRSERRARDGGICVIELEFRPRDSNAPGWEVEIHFDPKTNYLVRKVQYRSESNGTKYWREDEVLDFKDCSAGIYFPQLLSGRSGQPRNWRFESTTTISDIQVNGHLPNDKFRLRYPHGIILVDSIQGTSYRVNENGERISDETPLPRVPPPPVGDLEVPSMTEQTKVEPTSWTRWVFPVSLLLLIVSILAILVRRIR